MSPSNRGGLTRAELKTWQRYAEGTSALLRALDRAVRDNSEMSLDDFGLMRQLWVSSGEPVRMGELADRMSYSPSRLTHAVKRLEDRGWARREPIAGDARGRAVLLTDEGAGVLREAWPAQASMIRRLLLDQLSREERSVLEAIFARVGKAAREL